MEKKWYTAAYRRAVIDMHIPDWDPGFLAQFDADRYAQMLVKARAQSVVAYCQSHVGLFNFPTRVGRPHGNLRGRNLLQEIIDRCRARGIAVVVYTSLIFDRWAADAHPEWRQVRWDGQPHGAGGRHGLLCPNSPYREYVRAFVEEICRTFAFEGIRFDMTFWPAVCYCRHCRRRFDEEVGGELPTTVDWLEARWVAFQRCRERWLVEFAHLATDTVRRLRPEASVEHQSSTYPLDWMFGVTAALAGQNDFLQGDFYGDALQGSFVRKLLEGLTPHRPFGFETSSAVSLRDHTTLKSAALLEAKAAAAIADQAAFIFIDGIDPAGTLNPRVYERLGGVFDRLMPCYAHLGGRRVADVAVYFSTESKFSFAGNGRHVSAADRADAHLDSSMEAARRLIAHHLSFAVITKENLKDLGQYRVLLLCGVNMMDQEEVAAIRDWVRAGGALYASSGTSLVDKQGRLQEDFLLGEVLGVSLRRADWQEREHYLAPTAEGQPFFAEHSAQYPAFFSGCGMEVAARPGARVLATTTLPWPAPDPSRFSSIHSNPPWVATQGPEVVFNTFGRGRAIYCSSPLEGVAGLRETFVRLLRELNQEWTLEAEAPGCVEATLFRQPERGRYLLSLVNFQPELPNLPVEGIALRLRLPERVRRVVRLPGGSAVAHRVEDGAVCFAAPRLETLGLLGIEVEP